MHKQILSLCLFFLVFLLITNLAESESIKSLRSMEAELTISGNILTTGSIFDMELKIFIPQEGVKNIQVIPNNWEIIEDKLKNKMIKINWKNPSVIENYEVKIFLENQAKFFENLTKENWFVEEARKATLLTEVNDEMREFAFGRETELEKAVRILQWVETNIVYDYESVQKTDFKPRSAIKVWQEKKAVSGEFANLLVALLRSQNIPARVVSSYTLQEIETKELTLGHGWAEAYIDGKWMPLDVTFFEAGYLDAGHIKFANLLDNNASEILTYKGVGTIEWKRNLLKIKITNYTLAKPKLELDINKRLSDVVLIEGKVSWPCSLEELSLTSCVNESGQQYLEVLDPTRKFWFCDEQKIYWIVKIPEVQPNQIITCSLVISDQSGSKNQKFVKIYANLPPGEDVLITGPDQVLQNEEFTLKTDIKGLFFSPNLTDSRQDNDWTIKLQDTGKYLFYFYSDGKKGVKEVEVLKQKEFQILSVDKENATVGEWFSVNVTAKNLLTSKLQTKMRIFLENQNYSRDVSFEPLEEKTVVFNLTSARAGIAKLSIEIEGESLTSYSTDIFISEKSSQKDILEKISEIFAKIKEFLFNLFNIK